MPPVGSVRLGLPGIAGAATTSGDDWMPAKWDYTADVVVIGDGYAGQAAAIEADMKGSSVIILEKAPFRERGGNSRVCGQGLLAPSPAHLGGLQGVHHAHDRGPGLPDELR